PGFRGGTTPTELVSLIDLPSTILAAAGVTPPAIMRGAPVQRVVAGDVAYWQDDIFLQISESQCGRAIRTRKWKYSVVAPDKTGHDPSSDLYVEEYLYDLEADPHERTNLVDDSSLADVRAEMAARLKRRMVHAGEEEPAILSRKEYGGRTATQGG
ncbi:MAG TPA: arylsulfatase, partial [Candidatus Latescibacteria bacterium]|nr:arylsulfatase [Candidatus Latescibacterota bacterium]